MDLFLNICQDKLPSIVSFSLKLCHLQTACHCVLILSLTNFLSLLPYSLFSFISSCLLLCPYSLTSGMASCLLLRPYSLTSGMASCLLFCPYSLTSGMASCLLLCPYSLTYVTYELPVCLSCFCYFCLLQTSCPCVTYKLPILVSVFPNFFFHKLSAI